MSKNKNYYSFNVDRVETELPMFIEKVGKRWVQYGADNLFPQFIAGLYNKSAMNRTAIISKADAVFGKGLSTVKDEDNYLLKRANPKESWNDVFEKVILDYITFGGFALNVIWSNDGESIAEFYHIDFSKVRSGIHDLGTDTVNNYFYSSDWANWRKVTAVEYPAFNPAESLEKPNQLFYYFDYEPGSLFYPLPSYSGGLNDIQLDVEISKWHINNISNGLAPSLFIGLNNGVPDPEAREEIYDEITMAFRGSENAGKAFIAFSDDKEHAPDIVPIPSANSDYYVTVETRITSRILSAHRITSPLLLGLYHEGGTGFSSNADEIETAYLHFVSTVVKPIQKSMLKVINTLMYYKGYPEVEVVIQPNRLMEGLTRTDAVE
jgi:hypothetical protein